MNKYSVGIIGYGNFGKVLAKLMLRHPELEIKIYSRDKLDNKEFFKLEEVINCDYVFPAIPISALAGFLKQNSALFSPTSKSMYIDVCSVKVDPINWLSTYLPQDYDIVATHPLFGPMSSRNGEDFTGLKMVIDPTRVANIEKYKLIIDFFKIQKLELIYLSPKEHDKLIAYSQAVAFLSGRLGIELGLRENILDTIGFKAILANQKIVENDTDQLFKDMFTYNKYARIMAKEMLEKLSLIISEF